MEHIHEMLCLYSQPVHVWPNDVTYKILTIKLIRESVLRAEKQAVLLTFKERETRMRERMMKTMHVANEKENKFKEVQSDTLSSWL